MRSRTPIRILTAITLALGSGLLLWGCGSNRAQDASAPVVAEPEPTLAVERQDPAPEIERRLQELEEQMNEVAERERAVEAREEELVETARLYTPPTPEPAPPLEIAVPADPEPEPVAVSEPLIAEPLVTILTLPAATALDLQLDETVSSETHVLGDPVRAVLEQDVFWTGRVALPAGSRVLGEVTEVDPADGVGGQALLAVAFDRIELPGGEEVPITAYLAAEGKRQKKKDAATIGGSAAGGALLGRILGRDRKKGTVIGAVVGAAVGTAVASRNQGDPAVIEAATPYRVRLESPLEVAVIERPAPPSVARN